VKLADYIDLLTQKLRAMPEVKYTNSYVDILKSMNYYWFDMEPEAYEVPEDATLIGLYLEQYMGSVEPEVTRPNFDFTQQWANLQVILKDHKSDTIHNILEFIQKDVDTVGAEMLGDTCNFHVAAGIIPTYASIIDELNDKSVRNITQISIFIFFVCAIAFRSFVGGLIILVPLAIGKLIAFGVMGYGRIGYFLYTVPAIAPGMGIGVDYSIYVLERLKHELKEHGDDHLTAYVHALSTTGKAVIFTAMSVALGVSVLVFSELRFQALMGTMLAVVIVCNMLAALVLLPALISIIKPRFIYGKK
jgi:predicted RND superfamily exporter protein